MEERNIHAIPSSEDALEVQRTMRDLPPAHYRIKIESFSQLSQMLCKREVKKYDSGDFEVGGYKWRLSLYPQGDEKKNGDGHISLYLILAETTTLPLDLEVHAFFKLFVYDQIRDKYLTIQDVSKKTRRFHAMKNEWGFSQLLSLSTFNDAGNGYLVDDCCIFGAEIFVTNCTGRGECISIIDKPVGGHYTWTIGNFSTENEDCICSETFTAGGRKWCLVLFPKGNGSGNGKSLSFFLRLADGDTLRPGQKLFAEFKLLIKDQVKGNHAVRTADKARFSASNMDWGFQSFMLLSDLKERLNQFVVNGTLIAEGQILLLSVIKDLP